MNLLLVDDHTLFREALASLIAQRFPSARLAQAGSAAEAEAALAARPDTDLVLLDLNLPDALGVQAVQRLRRRSTRARLVVLSAAGDADTLRAARQAGADGYLHKSADSRVLLHALADQWAGAAAPDAPAAAAHPPDEAPDLGLTPRQRDVMRCLLQGDSNKLIARRLGLAESSVKTHVEAIFRRLGVSNRTQAVAAASRLGFSPGAEAPAGAAVPPPAAR